MDDNLIHYYTSVDKHRLQSEKNWAKRNARVWRRKKKCFIKTTCNINHLTMEIIDKLRWELLQHPPYSPDQAPSDYYLVSNLKRERHFIQIRRSNRKLMGILKHSTNLIIRKALKYYQSFGPSALSSTDIKMMFKNDFFQKCLFFIFNPKTY